MGNLKVADDECAELARAYRIYATKMDCAYNAYMDVLTQVCLRAITDGEVYANLQAFREAAQGLRGEFASVANDAADAFEGFVSDVDAADKYIY